MITESYFENIVSVLEKIKSTQMEKITKAAEIVSDVINKKGIIYMFGCGHSHLIALDCFYRAGGLANVSAMLDTDLMLHNGAAKSSKMEKMQGIAEPLFDRYLLGENDVLFIFSTSGKNAVPSELAKIASEKGIRNISVVSSAYFDDETSIPKLHENSDFYIDNCVPYGDAVIEIDGCEQRMGSVSTAASSFIIQSILLEAAQMSADKGEEIPVYMSGNIVGGSDFNKKLVKEYLPRIKHL
ncbi:MAG: SIS domain-containing protein [Ruminococcaceae bacterium]|nr:SIS domain-containing protein [Oscillospiraceae bacterium]